MGFLRHVRWWFGRPSANELIYIIVIDGDRSGYVRVKVKAKPLAEISVALSGAAQGRGAGSLAIQEVMRQTAVIPDLDGWQARIDSENAASLRAFAAAGFSPSGNESVGERRWLTLERRLA